MTIQLNEEQRRAVLMGQTVRLAMPEVGGDVVLSRAEQPATDSSPADTREGKFATMFAPFLRGFGSVLDMFSPPQINWSEETEGEKLQGDSNRIVADMQRASSRFELPAIDASFKA